MEMRRIPIVDGALGIIPKDWVKGVKVLEIRKQVETVQTADLQRSAIILRKEYESRHTWWVR